MNDAHMELLRSEGWRDVLRDLALPFAIDGLGWPALGDDVLEVGPGPGMTTELLRDHLGSLTCLELDDDLAAELADRYAHTSAVSVRQGDATDMPFVDATFSGAVCFTMLHHVPSAEQQDQLFREVARTLQPGGWFVANDSVASDDLEALHDDDVYNPVDPTTLEARLAAAGFVEVTVRHNDFAFASQARRPG